MDKHYAFSVAYVNATLNYLFVYGGACSYCNRTLNVRCVKGIVGTSIKKGGVNMPIIPIKGAPRELIQALIDAGILVVTEEGLKCAE